MDENPANSWVSSQDLDLCWRPLDPAASERVLREKLPQSQALDGAARSFHAELLTQIARAEGAQGKLAEARVSLDEAEKILTELQSSYPVRLKIRLLLEDGRLCILLRTPSQARTRFSQAWTLAVNGAEDFFVVDIARMMALIEPMKTQEEWIRKAIQVAEESKQEKTRRCLGDLYADLGWRHFDLRQFEASLEAHKTSLASFESREDGEGAFRAGWAVGRLLRQLGRVKEALSWNEKLQLERGAGVPSDGRLCEEIAECLLLLKRKDEAEPYFARAFHALSLEGRVPDRHPLKLKRLKDLGKVS